MPRIPSLMVEDSHSHWNGGTRAGELRVGDRGEILERALFDTDALCEEED